MFTKNPKTLVIESSAFGLSVSLPVMFSWWLRKDVVGNDKVFNLSIICFIIFFILYLILEASGLWAFVFGDNIKESLENTNGDAIIEPTVQPTVQPTVLPTDPTLSCKDKTAELEKELNKLKIIEPKSINILSDIVKGKTSGLSKIIIAICTIIIIFGFIIMVVAGNGVNKSIINDDDTHIYKHLLFCSPYATFILETLVFAVLSSAPIFLIAHDRNNLSEETVKSVYFGTATIKEFLLGAGKFAILFYILHYSGFWHHVLAPSNSK